MRAGLVVGTLLDLPAVRHQANNNDDEGSRFSALERVIRWQIAQFENPELRPAAAILFGTEPTSSGLTLTRRRRAAAMESGYEANHFRKRIEPQIVERLAWQLNKLSDDYLHPFALAPRLIETKERPRPVPTEIMAWEVLEHHTVVCYVWSSVYALRAALMNIERIVSMEARPNETNDAIAGALWHAARLLFFAADYRGRYADGAPGHSSNARRVDLLCLAGWTPMLTAPERGFLVSCVTPDEGPSQFLAHLIASSEGSQILRRWQLELGTLQE